MIQKMHDETKNQFDGNHLPPVKSYVDIIKHAESWVKKEKMLRSSPIMDNLKGIKVEVFSCVDCGHHVKRVFESFIDIKLEIPQNFKRSYFSINESLIESFLKSKD
jgi:hypothetical protein